LLIIALPFIGQIYLKDITAIFHVKYSLVS
jgi:hypothetical protein